MPDPTDTTAADPESQVNARAAAGPGPDALPLTLDEIRPVRDKVAAMADYLGRLNERLMSRGAVNDPGYGWMGRALVNLIAYRGCLDDMLAPPRTGPDRQIMPPDQDLLGGRDLRARPTPAVPTLPAAGPLPVPVGPDPQTALASFPTPGPGLFPPQADTSALLTERPRNATRRRR